MPNDSPVKMGSEPGSASIDTPCAASMRSERAMIGLAPAVLQGANALTALNPAAETRTLCPVFTSHPCA